MGLARRFGFYLICMFDACNVARMWLGVLLLGLGLVNCCVCMISVFAGLGFKVCLVLGMVVCGWFASCSVRFGCGLGVC